MDNYRANDLTAFLFTFKDPSNKPKKLRIINKYTAIYQMAKYDPILGFNRDLVL